MINTSQKEINAKIRKLKLLLLTNPQSLKYRSRFKHPQMQLIVSKILLLFDTSLPLSQLLDYEFKLLETNFTLNMYVDILQETSKTLKIKYQSCDWKSLGRFLYYIFKTSTYDYDKKHKVPNVFIINGENETNQKKRQYFNDFAISLENVDTNFNYYIKQILIWAK